mmetsp:Transcript_12862/g.19525  ORF Transcript_12862/g.19525 Transcript_12862/m.19525 type:complete len:634 (+) Transcript_12862:355-2256(+)|eukprot:CAMPEP_0196812090 /NCGR_PEP_ID=MMETSP1362-20130617/20226_1 /TAXON_ID=163516 /ORGANISM="Leptocylindrus danicus, Strain CCMP1856" /LENGTH=633 /DNA_ID=CAMNT_0042187509 /DNA_START=332 /DNA_END=2233 /DNA_ORIENTATION=-
MTDKEEESSSVAEKEEAGSEKEGEVWDIEKAYKKKDRTIRCMGKDGKCNQMAVAQWRCEGKEPWETCEDCQEDDFDGWPQGFEHDEDKDEDNHEETNQEGTADTIEEEEEKEEQAGSDANNSADKNDDDGDDDEEEEEDDEQWAVEHVYTIAEIDCPEPVICQSEECKLVACARWKSDTNERWDTCLDCQEKDYGGWPDDQEFVLQALEDKELVANQGRKCSKKSIKKGHSKVPNLTKKQGSGSSEVAAVTPPPSAKTDVPDAKQEEISNSDKRKSSEAALVSPQPVAMKKKALPQPTASALAMHRKWQEAAEAAGGKDARIVVSKAAAKKLIYDLLYDTFGVMNITGIYKALKCVVPSPVLRTCLDDMSFDASVRGSDVDGDGDDKDDGGTSSKNKGKSSNAEYAGSLSVKAGRNANTTLYYLDHTKLENGGNGLSFDVKDKLIQDTQNATSALVSLQSTIDVCNKEADALLREPTNEEADILLQHEVVAVERLKEEVESSQKLTVDVKVRKRAEKRLEAMALYWRKRKRVCIDFLRLMDESTEGTVSYKKCVAGDGQIDIESDEMIIKGAIERAKRKASNLSLPRKKLKVANTMPNTADAAATENTPLTFIGVRLTGNGKVERVHLKDVND